MGNDPMNVSMRTGSTARNDFQPSPLEPGWITEGTPTARSLTLAEAADGLLSCGLWDCTAGKFRYYYGCDEIIHILEGEAVVRDSSGEHTLRPGDVVYFPKGMTAFWTVPNYVRKFCIHRSRETSFLGKIRARVRGALDGLRGRRGERRA
jgi:uncharacterized cupin superfamily protein